MQATDEKTKVEETHSHLENVLSNDTLDNLKNQPPQHQHFGVDEELEKYTNSGIVIGEDENKRVLKLLNRRVLPIMIVTYFVQNLDKGTLAFSAVMGIREDNHLVGQQFSLLGTILYLAILVGEVPINRLIQILPVAKLLSALVTCWGILVICHAAAVNWAGLMVVRFLLGLFESGIQPILMTLTVMYYRRTEQPLILSFWFSMQAVQLCFSGIVSFGISFVPEPGPLRQWQVLFVIVGGLTILWGQVIFWCLPDSPMKAKCWSEEEKILIVERLRVNETGLQNKVFKREQMVEALTDPVIWCYVVMQISAFIVVGGLSIFSNVLVQGMGFSTRQTQLLNLAQGAVTFIVFISSAWLATRFKQTILIMLIYLLPAVAGTVAILVVPVTAKTATGLLIAFYAIQFFLSTGNLMWSLVSRNIAGQTKKVTSLTMMFVAYSVGCILGPQVFQANAAPRYFSAWAAHLAMYAVFTAASITARLILMRRNAVKRKVTDAAENAGGENEVIDHSNSFADITDRLNPAFRYDY